MHCEETIYCDRTPVLEPSFNSGGLAEAIRHLPCSGISHCEEQVGSLLS